MFRLKGRLCHLRLEKSIERFEQICWILVHILMGLTEEKLSNSDFVEGKEYERVTVGAARDDNSEKVAMKTYICVHKNDLGMEATTQGETDSNFLENHGMDK